MSVELRRAKFVAAIDAIIARGFHPSGARIRAELDLPVGKGMLNGEQTTWRREHLESLGWTRSNKSIASRWRKPK